VGIAEEVFRVGSQCHD